MMSNQKQSFKSKYLHSTKYDNYIRNSLNHTYNILEGSIRSSKSVANTLAFAMNIIQSPDTLHIVAATTAIVARSVFIENDGFGLRYFFDGIAKEGLYSGHPSLKISLPNKEVTVLIMGLQNAGSYRSFRGMTVGMIAITEVDLCDEESVIELINRTASSKRRRIFMDFNPNTPQHKIYSDELMYSVERLRKREDDVNYLHVTMRDNPAMTKEMLENVIKDYPPESVQFQRFIEGKRVVASDLIYRLNDWNYIDKVNPDDYISYIIVADPGIESSATVFVLLALRRNSTGIDVLKEYWHRNKDVKGMAVKMPNDYANDMVDFIIESVSFMNNRYPEMIFTDTDITFQRELRDALVKRKLAGIVFKDAIKEEINDRIKMGVSYLWTKKLSFSRTCEKTILSFKSAQYDSKKTLKGEYVRLDEPHNGTMIDAIDAVEYGMSYYNKRIYRK